MSNTVRIVFFLKPDAVIRRYVGARTLKALIEKVGGLKFLSFEEIIVDKEFLAEQHYMEHKGKFFFDWLVEYTSFAPIRFILIEATPKKIEQIRKLLGPTLVQKAFKEAPASIRGKFGIYGGVNVAHASDSLESAKRESTIWERYLMEKGIQLRDPDIVQRAVEEYIETYIDYPVIDNERYIELSEFLANNPDKVEEVKNHFISLLKKETDETTRSNKILVEKFAELLVRNVLLKR
ncbi:MAG: nucleoside-diphosphate kinase [Candidatus Njordarchaeales archaeon]